MIAAILGVLIVGAVLMGTLGALVGFAALLTQPGFWLVMFGIAVAGNARRMYRQRTHR